MTGVGPLVRAWRERRRLTQADLADQAEISTRHLSCIERGVARPSRQVVLVLASALEVPLRERNTLLTAAGFAAAYGRTDLDDDAMAQVRLALDLVLDKHEPYGAVVVDRGWDILRANRPWRTLVEVLLPGRPPTNLLRSTFDPEGLRPHVVNFEQVAWALLDRLRREAVAEGDPALDALHAALEAQLPAGAVRDWSRPPDLVVPVRLRIGADVLSLFTTLTTLGTPTDVTLSELRIEQYFPADAATEAWIRARFGAG